jgi:hypothetical protein
MIRGDSTAKGAKYAKTGAATSLLRTSSTP